MEIKIDEKAVQEALDTQATAGIKHAFESHSIRQAIETAISETVIPTIMAKAIADAASSIDTAALTQHLAEEIARSVTKGVQLVVRSTMIEILLKLKGIESYDLERLARERAKLEREF